MRVIDTVYIIMSSYNGYHNIFMRNGESFASGDYSTINALIDRFTLEGLRDNEFLYAVSATLRGVLVVAGDDLV